MTTPLLQLDEVVVRRDGFELSVPAWSVPPGCVVGVVGENGAGKSTLLSLLPGLLAPTRGEVRVFGLDPVANPVGVRLSLGFMTDDSALWELPIPRLLQRIADYYPSWDSTLCDDLLRRFDLPLRGTPSKLSKGEGTRLRLILAASFRPRLLVLDEPATGLDLGGRRALLRTILDALDDPGRSVIVSSHQLDDLERIADRLLVLHRGKVVKDGPTDDLVGTGRTLEEAMLSWGVVR